MNVFAALGNSLKLHNIKISMYPMFFNFWFSVVLYFMFYRLLGKTVGGSFVSHESAPYGAWTIISETSRSLGVGAPMLISLFVALGILFILVSIFVSGGIYGTFVSEEGSSFRNLLHLSGENFFKMFSMFLVNLINWIVVAVVSGILGFVLSRIVKSTNNEILVWPFIYSWIIVTALLVALAVAAYDFSRVIRLRDERHFFYSYKKGLSALFSNKFNVLALFTIFLVATIFSHLLLSVFMNQLGEVLHVSLLFLVFQGFIWFRYYLKTLLMNAEVHLLHF